jgi:hypothetical protein
MDCTSADYTQLNDLPLERWRRSVGMKEDHKKMAAFVTDTGLKL